MKLKNILLLLINYHILKIIYYSKKICYINGYTIYYLVSIYTVD